MKVFLAKFGESKIHRSVRRSRGGPSQACTAGSGVENLAMAKLSPMATPVTDANCAAAQANWSAVAVSKNLRVYKLGPVLKRELAARQNRMTQWL